MSRAPSPTRRSRSWRLDQCRAGTLPADALETADREALVRELWAAGWSDAEIATHTRLSTYTTGRIRARCGRPNPRRGR